MKKTSLRAIVVVLAVLVMVLSVACGPLVSAANEHDKLVELYQSAVTAKSTYGACADTVIGKMALINKTYSQYLSTEEARVEAWRQNVNAQSQALEDQRAAFDSAPVNEKGVVDLNQLIDQNATPAHLSSGLVLTLQAYAPTEAILPVLPTDVVNRVIDEQSEAMNMVFGCALDWNRAAQAYNAERSKINSLANSGKIIGDAANALGLTSLPAFLPLYQSSSSDQPIPTFGGNDG